jgi:hypothetical protein
VNKPPRKNLYVFLLFLDLTFCVFALLAGNTLMAAIWAGLGAHAAWSLKELRKGSRAD